VLLQLWQQAAGVGHFLDAHAEKLGSGQHVAAGLAQGLLEGESVQSKASSPAS
jgi:hypothetical protein